MTLVLAFCAFLWGLGWLLGVPPGRRALLPGLVLLAVLAAHAFLPVGHPILLAVGGSLAGWSLGLGALALIGLYAVGVNALRRQAPEAESRPRAAQSDTEEGTAFSGTELDRYARHIVLHEIGGPGQRALKEARVLVIGAGGLGSPALLYLAAAGVGTIGVVDDDRVENSNLQRQVIHRDADIGLPKVASAAAACRAQNPAVTIEAHEVRLDEDNAEALIGAYDLVLEGSDNFATRYLVNRVAARAGKPVIGAALSQWEGQISTWDPAHGGPCYACIFPEAPAPGLAPSCAEAGVLGPLPGVMGSMMAVEAIKEIAEAGTGLRGRMLIYDALNAEARVIGLKKRDDCPICGG